MSTEGEGPGQQNGTKLWPVGNAIIIALMAPYALANGIGSVPPLLALLLFTASSVLLYYILLWAGTALKNPTVLGASAIVDMQARCSIVALVVLGLATVFGAPSNPIERLISAQTTLEAIATGFGLLMFAIVAAMGLAQAFFLGLLVYTNAYGRTRID